MKILLRFPNWLGDGVMATPSLELLKTHFPNATFSIVASKVVCELFKYDRTIHCCIVDETKKSTNRFFATYKLAKKLGKHDIAITFTNHLYSALLLFFTKSTIRIGYKRILGNLFLTNAIKQAQNIHQVLRYANLLHCVVGKTDVGDLRLYLPPTPNNPISSKYYKAYIGLNPGGAYGSAKRWLSEYFAQVASYFMTKHYGVILFGVNSDEALINEIISKVNIIYPLKTGEANALINRCGKTSVLSLAKEIQALNVFITNDSGPLHIAAAVKTPTIALFGPTDFKETSPWGNEQTILLSQRLSCAPCKKRECPLKHHRCMSELEPKKVINATHLLLEQQGITKAL